MTTITTITINGETVNVTDLPSNTQTLVQLFLQVESKITELNHQIIVQEAAKKELGRSIAAAYSSSKEQELAHGKRPDSPNNDNFSQ